MLSPKTELNQQINSSLRIGSVTLRMCAVDSFRDLSVLEIYQFLKRNELAAYF